MGTIDFSIWNIHEEQIVASSDLFIFIMGLVATGICVGPYIALMVYEANEKKREK